MARCRGAPRIDSTGGGFDQRTSCPLLPPPTGMRDPADHVAPDLGHGGGRRAVGRNHPGRQGYRRRRPASRHLCDRAVRSPSPFRRLLSRRFFVPRHWQPRRPAARSFEALRDAAPRLPGCRHHRRPGRAPVECLASTAAGQVICCRWRNCNAQARRLSARGAVDPILSGHGAAAGRPSLPPSRFQTPCHAPQSMLGFPPTPHVHGALVHMARAGYILFTTYRRPCALFARRWAGESFALPLLTSTNVRTALPVVLPRLETAKSCPRPVRSTLYPALRYCRAARLSAAAPLAAFLRIVRLPDLADFRFMEERRATTISAFPSNGLLVIHEGPRRGRGGYEAAARYLRQSPRPWRPPRRGRGGYEAAAP